MNGVGVAFIVIIVIAVFGAVGWILFVRFRAQRLGLPPPAFSSFIPFRSSSPAPYGPPRPAPGGVFGWVNDRIRTFKNRNSRTAAGAYEGGGGGGSTAAPGRRGFGPLDPDEAWDSRVGNEADLEYGGGRGGYHEDQELGVVDGRGGYRGAAGVGHADDDDDDYNTGYLGVGGAGPHGGGSTYPMNLAATPTTQPPHSAGLASEDGRGRPMSRSPGPGAGKGGRNPFDDDAEPSNISLRGVSPRPIDTHAPGAQQAQGKDAGDSPTSRKSIFKENV